MRCLDFGLSYAKNGELLKYIRKIGSFDETCTRFYTAEMVSALEYLHGKGIGMQKKNSITGAYWELEPWRNPPRGLEKATSGSHSPQQTQSLLHTQRWLKREQKRNDLRCVLSPSRCSFPLVSLIGQTQLGAIRQRNSDPTGHRGWNSAKKPEECGWSGWKQKYQHIFYDFIHVIMLSH